MQKAQCGEMDARIKKWMKEIGGGAISFDVPMSHHTTFRVGGTVEALYRAGDLDELKAIVRKGLKEIGK